MSRDRHSAPIVRMAAARELLHDPRRKVQEARSVQVRVEWCYGQPSSVSNGELDAIELLLGPEFKTFTT
jgi:hypothetical protein